MEKSITRITSSEKQFGSNVDKRDELENETDGPEIVEQSSTDDHHVFEQSKSQPSVKQKKDKRIVRGILLGILLSLIDIGLIILISYLFYSHKKLIEQLDNQQKDIYKLKQCSSLYAGFTLNLSDEEETGYPWIPVSSGHTVKFKKVMENAGQGYDPNTGKFTAAISGLYSFQINIVAWKNKRACIALKKGREDPIARAFAKAGYWESGSASAVVEMAAGDVIEAVACVDSRFSAYTSDPAYGRSTVFSGHLIEVANCSSSPLVLKSDVSGDSPLVLKPDVSSDSPLVLKPDVSSDSPLVPEVSSSDWQIVFRGRSSINTSMYEAYTTSPSLPVTQTCKHPFDLPCYTHYRNDRALDNWQDVDEVAVHVYKGGQRVAWAVFDGAGSDYQSWFSKQTLKDSHWTDLTKTSTTNFFSTNGHTREASGSVKPVARKFFISKYYALCPGDVGWFVVVDRPLGHCDWEKTYGGFPQIMYSTRETASKWNDDKYIGHADDFVVYVKYVDGTVLG